MKNILVTGAEGFLGYHIIKLLNERNIKPRVIVDQDIKDDDLNSKFGFHNLKIDEIFKGSIEDLSFLQKSCQGIDTVFHMKFKLSLGGNQKAEEQMQQVNVIGNRNLLEAATAAKVKRLVFNSSALTVGLSREPQLLDEASDWLTYQVNLPYALSRRAAEQEILAVGAGPDCPVIVAVNPSLVMGPEDYLGAPANRLLQRLSNCKGPVALTIPGGISVVDVRDYADGALRAAETGRHGQRYLLSGENTTTEKLMQNVAGLVGVQSPSWLVPIPFWVILLAVKLLGLLKPVPSSILELWDRYAWYDTKLAQGELGWQPRPLRDTIADSLRWLREQER
jgi:dihydroflavonol-4-reductase